MSVPRGEAHAVSFDRLSSATAADGETGTAREDEVRTVREGALVVERGDRDADDLIAALGVGLRPAFHGDRLFVIPAAGPFGSGDVYALAA